LVTAFLATSYQIGGSVGHLIGGVVAARLGPGASFVYPMFIAAPVAFVVAVVLPKSEPDAPAERSPGASWFSAPPRAWLLGSALSFINVLRYGLLLWLPALLIKAAGVSQVSAALSSFTVVTCGVLGTLATGAMTRRTGARPTRVVVLALISTALACSAAAAAFQHWWIAVLLFAVSSASVYAAHSMCVATLPALWIPAKHLGMAVGTIDALGYVGAGFASVIVGLLADKGDWQLISLGWASFALVAALLIATASLPVLESRTNRSSVA
jgi:sugar phosphate permease